jgi:hypothetical protein
MAKLNETIKPTSDTIAGKGSTPVSRSVGSSPISGGDTYAAPDNPRGYGSTGPTDNDRKAADNLGSIAGYNRDTVRGAADNASRVYDISDQQNANLRALQTTQNKRDAGSDWYTQQQKLQAVTSSLMDTGGNAFNGSGIYDLWDMIGRKDDMDDAAVLNQMRQNQNTVDNNYWEAIMASNNGRNESAMDTESNLREIVADWAAQMNNIHPDLAADNLDTGNHTINAPDWLSSGYFDQNVRQAITPDEQGLYRPENAASDAWAQGLMTGQRNTASSANKSYRDRLMTGYSGRNR